MEDYNFWADLLASYRASPDFIKALWLMVPLIVAAGLFVLMAGAAMRLVERRGVEERPRNEEGQAGQRWLAAAQLPLIAHQRTEETENRRRP